MKRLIVFIIIIFLFFIVLQNEELQQILDSENFLESKSTEDATYDLLWLTMPLFIIQGVITSFPFLILLILHVALFGIFEGIVLSWIGTFLGSMVCFYLGRYFFHGYFTLIWSRYFKRYRNWIEWASKYGMWGIIVLRHLPFMPSNIISLIGAFSPIPHKAYLWSSILGNLSMVWLYALFSVGIANSTDLLPYLLGYLVYLICLIALFTFQVMRMGVR